jgi:peptidoglycan/LPS O-acetylase OafA/YrhL
MKTHMGSSRSFFQLFIGVLSILFALLFVVFGGLMLVLETPPLICLATAGCSVFPALIAVACLMPSQRSWALRIIGAIVCVGCIAAFIANFVAPPEQGRPVRKPFMLLLIAGAGGVIAVKGKWPGVQESDSPAQDILKGTGGPQLPSSELQK